MPFSYVKAIVVALLFVWKSAYSQEINSPISYIAWKFSSEERWQIISSGNPGGSRLEGNKWYYDFSKGAEWISLKPPEKSLLSKVTKIRLRSRGSAKNHSVKLLLKTHFMTFEKTIGEFSSTGDQEFYVDAPPGNGWAWNGGQDDGKMHGPLRISEIRLEANGIKDSGFVEMQTITIDGTSPSDRLCMASTRIDNKPVFNLDVQSLADSPLEGSLSWTIRNWDQRPVLYGKRPVKLPPNGVIQTITIPVPQYSLATNQLYYQADFELTIPSMKINPVTSYWMNNRTIKDDTNPDANSPMGMALSLCWINGEFREKVALKAQQAGVKWTREMLSWPAIETEAGKYNWEHVDQLLDCCERYGFSVCAVVMGWPSWTKPYTREAIRAYAKFLSQLVKRYHPRIQNWEIWNEPNFFFWLGPKELYAEMLIESYAAIKQVSPKANVLGLSTWQLDRLFIQQMLAKGAPFDILTVHPYRETLDDGVFIAELKQIGAIINYQHSQKHPIWITEIGWPTHVQHPNEDQDFTPTRHRDQANYLIRTYLSSFLTEIETRVFWHCFRDEGYDPYYFEHNMGIITHDLLPKPSYWAYSTLARLLKNRTFVGTIDAGWGNFACRFVSKEPNDPDLLALWNPKNNASVKLPLKTEQVTLINGIGEQWLIKTIKRIGSQNRQLRLNIEKGSPIYLIYKEDK